MKTKEFLKNIYKDYNTSLKIRNDTSYISLKINEFEEFFNNNELNAYIFLLKEAKINIQTIENKIIYRGVTIKWLLDYFKNKGDKISNYINSYNEACFYGEGIVCEFEYQYNNSIKEEEIGDRKEDIKEYDDIIIKSNIDGFKWYIGSGMYVFRIKNSSVILKKIIYHNEDRYSKLILMNRKYEGLSQKQLAEKIGTKQPKIAQYENGNVIPDISRLLILSNFIPYEQIIRNEKDLIIR